MTTKLFSVDSYDLKSMPFKFGNAIFKTFEMPTYLMSVGKYTFFFYSVHLLQRSLTRRIPFRGLNGCIVYCMFIVMYHNKVHTITYYLPACNACRTIKGQFSFLSRAVGIRGKGGGAGNALLYFGTYFNPISIRGGRLYPSQYYSPPRFLHLPTALSPLRLLRDNCTINRQATY